MKGGQENKLETIIVKESWSYTSYQGSGSDFGERVGIYCKPANVAVFVETRDRSTGFAPWKSSKLNDPAIRSEYVYDQRCAYIDRIRVADCKEGCLDSLALFRIEREQGNPRYSHQGTTERSMLVAKSTIAKLMEYCLMKDAQGAINLIGEIDEAGGWSAGDWVSDCTDYKILLPVPVIPDGEQGEKEGEPND